MYLITGEQFGLKKEGIDLLRSGFPYQSIEKDSIESIHIFRGHNYQRWRVMLVLGIALIGFVMYYSYLLYLYYQNPNYRTLDVKFIAAIGIPFFLGAFLVVASLQKGPNLKVEFQGTRKILSLRKIQKDGNLPQLIEELQSWVSSHRLNIDIAITH